MSKIGEELRRHVPEIDAQLKREEDNRTIAVLDTLIPLLGGWFLKITPRIKADLEAQGNAFIIGRMPMRKDVFNFLWRISPEYLPAYRVGPFRTPLVWWKRRRLWWVCQRIDLFKFQREIGEYLSGQMQDAPGAPASGGDADSISTPPAVHWAIGSAAFWMREFGLTLDGYLDMPYSVLNQLYRIYQHEHGARGCFINRSDAMINRFVQSGGKRL